MKKFLLLASTTLLFLVTSCNFFEAPTENKNGSIIVDLGNNSRAVQFIDQDSVTDYIITVSGNGYSDKKNATLGSSVLFDNLEPGTYTVSGIGCNDDNTNLVTASTTVTVKSLEDSKATLIFKKYSIAETRFQMFNYGSNYKVALFDNIEDLVMDLGMVESSFLAVSNQLFEMPSGDTYFIYTDDNSDKKVYTLAAGSKLPDNNSLDTATPDFIVADTFNAKKENGEIKYSVYAFTQNSNNRNQIDFKKYSSYPNTVSKSSNFSFSYEIISLINFVVHGNDIFIVYKPTNNKPNRLAWVHYDDSSKEFTQFKNFTVNEIAPEFSSNAEFRDITMPKDGELYAIIGENGKIQNYTSLGFTTDSTFINRDYTPLSDATINNTAFYNRGALIKLDYNYENQENPLRVSKSVGWYDTKRELHSVGEYTFSPKSDASESDNQSFKSASDSVAKTQFSSVDLYAPTKRQSSNYFYGPVKFICTKPDELYIVDSGFNIRLADWNAVDDSEGLNNNSDYNKDQKGLTANYFNHERVIKVNLADFAMKIEREYNSAWSYLPPQESFIHPETLFLGFSNNDIFVKQEYNVAQATGYLGIHPNPVELDD